MSRNLMRFQALRVASMKMNLLANGTVLSRRITPAFQRCHNSETSVCFYDTTRRHIPEGYHHQEAFFLYFNAFSS
jgi:hypothetical protein